MKNYEDIMHMPHHVSTKHPQLSREQRAGQFSPFAALTGFEDEIDETARLTDRKLELDENEKQKLDGKLGFIRSCLNEGAEKLSDVTITYFVPDSEKAGGAYLDKTGKIKKIDEIKRCIVFVDKTELNIDDIADISLDYFDKFIDN